MPLGRAVKAVGYFLHTTITEATVPRQTEAAGAADVAVPAQEVERLEHEAQLAPKGPDQQFLSGDGAFGPLIGGEWAEVKTLAIGECEASGLLSRPTDSEPRGATPTGLPTPTAKPTLAKPKEPSRPAANTCGAVLPSFVATTVHTQNETATGSIKWHVKTLTRTPERFAA